MSTKPTNNPIPSESPKDLKFNAGNFDKVMNSDEEAYQDRFGKARLTMAGFEAEAQRVLSSVGYSELGDWELGKVITGRNQIVFYNGSWYRYNGELPYTIDTPEPGEDWVNVGDAYVRGDLSSDLPGNGDSMVAVKQPYDGSVKITQHEKNSQSLGIKDFGATGDGSSDDSGAFNKLKSAASMMKRSIINLAGGLFNLSGVGDKPDDGFGNDISALYVRSNKPSVQGVIDGSRSSPSSDNKDPALWVQKHTSYDNPGDPFAHNIGSVYGGTLAVGSKSSTEKAIEGTWISGVFNCKLDVENVGTESSPKYDAKGNSIGLAGFAESTKPGDGHITCGVWGVASSPTMTKGEYDSFDGNFATAGMEINLNINHPQPDYGSGKGESMGMLINNYRFSGDHPDDPVAKDVSDGIKINGANFETGGYDGDNVDVFNGYMNGININVIKRTGIKFGKMFANGSVGIEFPDSYAGMLRRPRAAMVLGDNLINWGSYTGSVFADGDMWSNAGALYFRRGGTNQEVVTSMGIGESSSYTANRKIKVNIGGTEYYILASTAP